MRPEGAEAAGACSVVMDGLETTVATWGALEAPPAVETVGSVVKGVVVMVPVE